MPLLSSLSIPLTQPHTDQLTLGVVLLIIGTVLLGMLLLTRLFPPPAESTATGSSEARLLQVGRWLAATPAQEAAVAATAVRSARHLFGPQMFAVARLNEGRLEPLQGELQSDWDRLQQRYRASSTHASLTTASWVTGPADRHGLIVPIHSHTRPQGVFIAELQAEAPDKNQIEYKASHLAAWLGPVMERLGFREQAEANAGQLMLLGEISRRLISLRPLEERWNTVAPIVSQVFNFAHVTIYELSGDMAVPVAASHSNPAAHETVSAGEGLVGEALARREITTAAARHESSATDALAVPLMVENRLLGVMHLTHDGQGAFTAEEAGLAEMLAGQLAIAALEAQNYSQQQEYTWYNTVMLEVTRHAAQPGDPEAALRGVLQLTTMLAGADWAVLLLNESSSERLVLGPSSGVQRPVLDSLDGLTLEASSLGITAPYQESEDASVVELPKPLDTAFGESTCLAMALSDGSSLLGVLLVSGTARSGARRNLLVGISHQISLRIENSRLIDELAGRRALEREIETARSIQESFLPESLPAVSGWQIGATWLAARQVGGDFFDFIPLPEGPNGPRWGVVIADVADKGVPAALFMALCRTLVRAVALTSIEPAEVLARTNQLILDDTRAELFVSLFYGLWQPELDVFQYASAGHNPPIVYYPSDELRLLREHGMVLGVSPKASYQNHQIELAPGSTLVMYTDGVTEAISRDGTFFGLERLQDLVREQSAESAQTLAQSIKSSVRDFCLTEDPPDDLTTVVIRRMPREREGQ